MTHVLLWDGIAHTLEVATVADMLSRNRMAYTDDLPAYPVPLFMGTEAEMRAARDNCARTILVRRSAKEKALAVLRRAMA